MRKVILLTIFLLVSWVNVYAARLKDIAHIYGVRSNQLIGYGLVVGLAGTGDSQQIIFSLQSIVNMLERFGVKINPAQLRTRNVAAVMVTANIPPFAKTGSKIDALVASMGDAKSLEGGMLLMTPLRGPDGQIYAVAQGPISIGGFGGGGAGGRVRKNFLTVGRVVNGAMVEREIPTHFASNNELSIVLNQPDFTTAAEVASVINKNLSASLAKAVDATTIKISIPHEYQDNLVDLVARLERLEVTPNAVAKVVVNERTGTVVIGENVHISTVAVAQGGLSIIIKETPKVSQPLPFSTGETIVTPETKVEIKEEKTPLYLVPQAATIGELVRALNAIGATPRDLIAILQAIKAAGALQAELEVI
ncbi:MAG: flagellar basal body P-ring protein FlgI [Candidatus Desulfofervidaceae bacterium]|nr:flagellar basal body P-ring protein FlgI [Candidatus Desulfofervidaceae bacterium]